MARLFLKRSTLSTLEASQLQHIVAYEEAVDTLFNQIWAEFLRKLQEEIDATSQADVARRLGVNRGQVSKWLSGLQIGGNLKTFISHSERLGIDWGRVVHGTPQSQSTPFDDALLETLHSTMKVLGVEEEDIMYANRTAPLTTRELYEVCKTVGVEPSVVLKRAAELAEGEQFENKQTA